MKKNVMAAFPPNCNLQIFTVKLVKIKNEKKSHFPDWNDKLTLNNSYDS